MSMTSPDFLMPSYRQKERDLEEQCARLEREEWRRTCRTNLTAWCIEALAPLGQTPARHHRLLIHHLERLARGDNDRLIVAMPPGSAKTTYASILFAAWFLAQGNGMNVAGLSHGADLAEKFSASIQQTIRRHSDVLGYGLASESVREWRTTNGGSYIAAGVGGSLTGRRLDCAIIDDPFKDRAAAESRVIRDAVWDWYQNVVYTRRVPGYRIMLIMTRWHLDDLAGRLLDAEANGGDKWEILRLPAIADSLQDPLGRAIGEPLWPERESRAELDRIKANIGEYAFGALYQQDPQPPSGSFFNEASFLIQGAPAPMPTRCDTVFAVIDTAVKTGKGNDGTAVLYCGYDAFRHRVASQSQTLPADREVGEIPLFLLDWDYIQIEGASLETWLPGVFQTLEMYSRSCGARRGSIGAYIEDKASGMVLLQHAERNGWPAQPIESKLTSMGKVERGINASPYVQSGLVKVVGLAYDKVVTYKGRSANHLLMQLLGFRVDSKDGAADDLFDTAMYAIMLALGETNGF